MNTLEIDSLMAPQTFSEDLAGVQQAVCDSPADDTVCCQRNVCRPYLEVAVLLCVSGVTKDVLSIQQVSEIENRALRKLRRHPAIGDLYREICGRTPAMA
jgi:hypothetical protein